MCLFFLVSISSGLISAEKNIFSKESIINFGQLNGKQKMEFFNALNKQDRMKFIIEFIKERTFDVPPVEVVKFYSDGEFIFDSEADGGGMAGGNLGDKTFRYFLGKWIFKDGLIFVDAKDPMNDVFGKHVVLDDVKIENYYEDRKSAQFVFHILKGQNFEGKDLSNNEVDIWGGFVDSELKNGASPAIDFYTKLKNDKKKANTEKK